MVEWGKAITNVARREGLGEVLEGRPLPEVSHCMWNRYKQPAPEAQTYSWLIIAEGDTLQRAVISLKTGLPSPGNGS